MPVGESKGADRSGADGSAAEREASAERAREANRRARAEHERTARTASAAGSPTSRAAFDAGQRQLEATGFEAKQRVDAGIRDTLERQGTASSAATATTAAPAAATAAVHSAGQVAAGQPPASQSQIAAVQAPSLTTPANLPTSPTPQVTLAQFAPASPIQTQQPFRGPTGFGMGVGIAVGAGLTPLTPQGQAVLDKVGLANVLELSRTPKIQRAAQHLGVSASTVEGLLAAKAYQDVIDSSRNLRAAEALQRQTGLDYDPAKVVQNGPHLNALAETVARVEYDNPGTWDGLSDRNASRTKQQAARELMQSQIGSALKAVDLGYISTEPGALIGPGLMEARIGIDPALSTYSRRARRMAGLVARNPNFQAHHLVPFESVFKMHPDAQMELVRSGWRVDNPGNLVALPANIDTYVSELNINRHPYHMGPHPNYTRIVDSNLSDIRNDFWTMSKPELLAQITVVERSARSLLDHPSMHARLN